MDLLSNLLEVKAFEDLILLSLQNYNDWTLFWIILVYKDSILKLPTPDLLSLNKLIVMDGFYRLNSVWVRNEGVRSVAWSISRYGGRAIEEIAVKKESRE